MTRISVISNLAAEYPALNQKKEAIYCQNKTGICFGDFDFSLNENMRNGCTYANNFCNFLSNENLELTGGNGTNENFETEEFEVYKVIY